MFDAQTSSVASFGLIGNEYIKEVELYSSTQQRVHSNTQGATFLYHLDRLDHMQKLKIAGRFRPWHGEFWLPAVASN